MAPERAREQESSELRRGPGPGQIAPKRASERDGKKKSCQNARVSAMHVKKRASEHDFLKLHRQKRARTRE